MCKRAKVCRLKFALYKATIGDQLSSSFKQGFAILELKEGYYDVEIKYRCGSVAVNCGVVLQILARQWAW